MKTLLLFLFNFILSIFCVAQKSDANMHLHIAYSYTSYLQIDIDSIINNGCDGSVKIYADEYVEQPEKPTDRHYEETFHLEPLTASKIVKLYLKLKVGQTDEWKSGLDGTNYDIDFTDMQGTSHKKFWSPDKRKSTQSNVRAFIDSVHLLLTNTEAIFRSHNPFQCNYIKNNGGDIECRVLSKQQKRKYKAERERFRKTQSSTIQ